MMHPAVPGVIASRWDSADGGGWKRMLHNTKGVTLSVPRAAPEASATAGEVKGPSAAAVAAAKPVVIETASLAANLASAGAVAPADFASLAHAFAEEDGESSRKKADPSPAGGNSDGRSAAGGERQNLLLTPQAAGAAAPPPPSLFSARSKFSFDKTFHVSPFMALNHRYEWIFTPPGETLLVQSQNTSLGEGGERMLNTQLRLTRVDGGSDSWATWLYLLLVAFPFLTMRIQWWIHWEAFRVWWKVRSGQRAWNLWRLFPCGGMKGLLGWRPRSSPHFVFRFPFPPHPCFSMCRASRFTHTPLAVHRTGALAAWNRSRGRSLRWQTAARGSQQLARLKIRVRQRMRSPRACSPSKPKTSRAKEWAPPFIRGRAPTTGGFFLGQEAPGA